MFRLQFSNSPRRSFLQVGALTTCGLTQAHLLQAAQQPADETARPGRRAKSVILVYLGGGLSHHDSFDMKPEAAAESCSASRCPNGCDGR